ncbi:hypothetical protein [Planctomicrobium sp. SH527]|uniref:hypothetical protein n=1 Tax=Planctomicrobium sp. SH527 TaxID=3448123 RepID=UPI003F5B4846
MKLVSTVSVFALNSFRLPALILGFVAVSLTGCSQTGPDLAKVTGTVSLDGKPVPGAVIRFIPQGEKGSPSYGGTDDSGNYKLMFSTSKDGAMLGEHFVEISTTKISKSELAELKAAGENVPTVEFVAIPKKYNKRGTLTATVTKGRNDIDFDLTSK